MKGPNLMLFEDILQVGTLKRRQEEIFCQKMKRHFIPDPVLSNKPGTPQSLPSMAPVSSERRMGAFRTESLPLVMWMTVFRKKNP